MRGVRQLGVRNASRVHARAADANLAPVPADVSQHDFRVVVPLGDFLVLLRAGGSIPNQERLRRSRCTVISVNPSEVCCSGSFTGNTPPCRALSVCT